jgi:hypothetical protein
MVDNFFVASSFINARGLAKFDSFPTLIDIGLNLKEGRLKACLPPNLGLPLLEACLLYLEYKGSYFPHL